MTYEELKVLDLAHLLEELSKGSTGSTLGKDLLEKLPPFIWVRTAEMLSKQLASTSGTVSESANRINETLNHSTDTVKATLENSSDWLINALKVSTDTSSNSAREIAVRIADLTNALSQANSNLQLASTQSAALGRRLNWLTGILVGAALMSAAATGFYAWETKRQVDLMQDQFQRTLERSQPNTNSSVPKK
jgi:flagellar hook-basal body complex protein FliE